jgi:hypothetical protein
MHFQPRAATDRKLADRLADRLQFQMPPSLRGRKIRQWSIGHASPLAHWDHIFRVFVSLVLLQHSSPLLPPPSSVPASASEPQRSRRGRSSLLSARAIKPRLDCSRIESPSAPYAALINEAISGTGRGTNPASVLRRSGTPARNKPAGLQLRPSPPGPFVKREIRITLPSSMFVMSCSRLFQLME